MGEVLYRWLFSSVRIQLPGAFLFLIRYRTGLKTGNRLLNSYSPMVVINQVSVLKKILSFYQIKRIRNVLKQSEKQMEVSFYSANWYHWKAVLKEYLHWQKYRLVHLHQVEL